MNNFVKTFKVNREQLRNLIFHQSTPTALKFTYIIYIEHNGALKPLGSCILAQMKKDLYLLTAGHVLSVENIPYALFPYAQKKEGPSKLLSLAGCTIATTFEKNNSSEKIDFSIVKLGPRQSSLLHEVKSNERLLTFPDYESTDRTEKFFTTGYPANSNKKDLKTGMYFPQPFRYVSEQVEKSIYEKYGFDPQFHFLIKYDRKKIFRLDINKKITPPNLEGMSGGGLWAILDFLSDSSIPKFALIGILIEYNTEYKYIASLRIGLIEYIIKEIFDKNQAGELTLNFGTKNVSLYVITPPDKDE